jgi:acetyl-CoA acetyltransferase
MASRDAVICQPLRTPVGRFGGVFRDVSAAVLAATVVRELVERTALTGEHVDDVIMGQCYAGGEAPAIGRVAALDAGLSVDVPGLQIDRRCGSGLQAVLYGCMQVQTGAAELVLAGGADSMSQAEFYSTRPRWGVKGGAIVLEDRLERARVNAGGINHPVRGGMLETAENVRREYAIGRDAQDERWPHSRAARSRRRSCRSRCRAGAARCWWSWTSTRARTRRSRPWRACARSWARTIPGRRSRRATAAARTTALRCAW